MADFTLVIGNKNYSSWSLRGWLMARVAGIEFEEILVPLDLPETQSTIRKHSPSGRVPVLLHRGLAVWESLAIGEYLNDLKPEAAEDDFARYAEECRLADAAVAGLDFDDAFDVHGQPHSLRLIYVHMIAEYSRHNGHADLLRESIDGATGR